VSDPDLRTTHRGLRVFDVELPDLDPAAAPAMPDLLFAVWLGHAIDTGVREPHATTLSTVDAGAPALSGTAPETTDRGAMRVRDKPDEPQRRRAGRTTMVDAELLLAAGRPADPCPWPGDRLRSGGSCR
jgi:hypothetical protein